MSYSRWARKSKIIALNRPVTGYGSDTVYLTVHIQSFYVVFVSAGEACGLAMGLVMLGSKSASAIEEMVGVS